MALNRTNVVGAARDALRHNPVGQSVVGTRVLNAPFAKAISRKYFYPFLTRRLSNEDFLFINWGYEEDPPMELPLADADEQYRYNIQLYHATATQTGDDLAGKRVLEVSCGHGGAASYFTRTMKPASYTGLDFNPDGIAFCKKRHQLPGLDFVHGDAENLPFPDESFDAVINVEASHVYTSFPKFLEEVGRVLSPGGILLYTDMRTSGEFAEWETAMAEAPLLQIKSERIIDAEVLRGLEKTAQMQLDMVCRGLPAILRPIGRQIVVAPGSRLYRDLENGDISYRMYAFIKN
ncbi:MAG: phthiotriol/phenolphthiotriol dimycocerosates methyltransferase [Mycolicibacterium sp.]|uniref:phthiotriol/phenolphthiotriol dimycocerosates methyltransferase n=1 Tax=Mycolicibacterium sp. TaxID=2320850 RepID=UPI003D12DD8C